MTSPHASAAGTFAFGGELTVNRMGYGSMRLSGPAIMGPPRDHDEAIAVLREAVALGVNHIDTSDYYGPFVVNELIKEALHPYPTDLVLVTKVGALRNQKGAWLTAISPQELRDAVHDNLTRLGMDAIHCVNLRLADDHGGVFREGSLAEPFGVLADLREQGKIRHLGVSNVGADQLAEAQTIAPVACVQNAYNVIERGDDTLVDSCAAQGIAFVPFFPLGGFAPFQADRFADLAAKIGASTMQLALAWLLARSPSILAIPGTSSRSHLRENVAAASLELDASMLAELAAVAGSAAKG